MATGFLLQEERLQALEERLAKVEAKGTDARLQQDSGTGGLSLETRVTHLEEDLSDLKHNTEVQLEIVKTNTHNLHNLETSDIRRLHNELDTDVNVLNQKLNTSITKTDVEIDTIDNGLQEADQGVILNAENLQFLRSQLHTVGQESFDNIFKVEDDVFELEDEINDVSERVGKLENDGKEEQPGVGPIGFTGGQSPIMQAKASRFEAPVHHTRTQINPSQDEAESQVEDSATRLAIWQGILDRLKKYNM